MTPPGRHSASAPESALFAIGFFFVLVVAVGAAVSFHWHAPDGCYPEPGDVVLGAASVVTASVLCAYTVHAGRVRRNPIWWGGTAGLAIFVIGVVGQRATAGAQSNNMSVNCLATGPLNIWTVGIHMPLGVTINDVAAAGILLTVAAAVVLLLVERVGIEPRVAAAPASAFEESDSV